MVRPPSEFRFKKQDRIGNADAEADASFLAKCFVDTGDLAVLRRLADPRRVVVGRTGAGKTALLQKLAASAEHCIQIRPESLALSYISNCSTLKFVEALGVQLDLFFRLLWRHVFAVEIIREHANITTERDKTAWLARLKGQFPGNKKHLQAVAYLEKWGKSFWEETDYRIKEVTKRLEQDLEGAIGATDLPLSVAAASRLSTEERTELIQRSQKVVNSVQIQELSQIMEMLNDVLGANAQKRYYLVIDRLDERWVEDKLRYKLIRALIETVRDFLRIRQAKIVVALRRDLIDRVIARTRDAGFQEEKYADLFLPITWTRPRLIEILDTRVNYLVRRRYTKGAIGIAELLPRSVDGTTKPLDYILERTLLRPRDAIMFFNECISQATDEPEITAAMIKHAEGGYSRKRLGALVDEWIEDYPNLLSAIEILRGRPSVFTQQDFKPALIEEFLLNCVVEGCLEGEDRLGEIAREVCDQESAAEVFLRELLSVLYQVGVVGFRFRKGERVEWAIHGGRPLRLEDLRPDTRISVHRFVWRALGISPVK